MRKKRLMVLGCAALITAMAAGCGSGSGQNETADTAIHQETNVQEEAQPDAEQTASITVKITSVDGNTVTADIGEIKAMEMTAGADGQAPSGSSPDGQAPDGQAPDKQAPGGSSPDEQAPDGQAPDGQAPDKQAPGGSSPGGQAPGGQAPGGQAPGGNIFESSGGSITFTISENTAVTLEYLQGSGDGSLDDIAVGAVLEVTLDETNCASLIIVKNLNAGNGFGGSKEVTNGSSVCTIDEDSSITKEAYSSSGDDENALRVDGAAVTFEDITIDKTGGESSNTEDGDFYGQNAGFLALNGADVTITNAVVNTSAVNGNGIFSYGEGTTVNIYDSVIRTSERNSGGIQTTGGGTTNAYNLDIETQGSSSAAIRSDRGGGTVNVNGGTYVTNGTGSPAVYCTADITVSDAELTANASEGIVVEGRNSVSLKNCNVTGNMSGTYGNDSDENIHGIMIYQSMSGDAEVGEAYFSAEGGSITVKTGDLFYITNTDCEIILKNVTLQLANDILLRIEGNSSSRGWGTQGANGGDVIFTADSQELTGTILADSISTLNFTMKNGSSLTGAINPDGEGGSVDVNLESGSSWSLTADSYITSFTGELSDITSNGFHLYVNGEMVL